MISISEDSANVEHKQHAHANNPDIPTSSFDQETVSGSGGDQGDKTLLLSRELAVKLNPDKADFSGSLILYGLYLWQIQKIRPFAYTPMVDGKRGCYQSLSDLHAEYPWLSEEGIRVILRRCAETLGKNFIVDAKNPGAIRNKFHFHLSPLLIKKYGFNQGKAGSMSTAKGLIGLSKLDAANYGVLEAVLLHNLRYVTLEEHNTDPLVDDDGRIYRELSPTKLTKLVEDQEGSIKPILPVSREAVSKALSTLKQAEAIAEHPDRRSFYRVTDASETAATGVIKVADSVIKVASAVNRVARRKVAIDCKPFTGLALQPFVETSDRNTDRNSDRKCISASPVSRSSTENGEASELSAGAKELVKIINDSLEAFRQKPTAPDNRADLDAYKCFEVLDYDNRQFLGYDLFYDVVNLEPYSGKPYSRKAELEEFMEQMLQKFQFERWTFSGEERMQVRQLFVQHPLLTAEHLLEVMNHSPWNPGVGYNAKPKKGHDYWHWARRITNPSAFLHYLPQLICEYAAWSLQEDVGDLDLDDKGRPIFDYSMLPRPLLDIAFGPQSAIPITHISEEDEDGDYFRRPVYYPEFVGLPITEYVTFEDNPLMMAA